MGFFEEYFVDPIVNGTGYNIYNTAVYAVLLIAAAFLTFRLLKRMKIKIDNNFLYGVLPFVILGGLLRAMQDAGVVQSVWFITPLIYITIFVIALAALVISKTIEGKYVFKRFNYHKIWFSIGAAAVLMFLVQVNARSELALFAITLLAVFWALILIFIKKLSDRYKIKFFSWENTALIAVHMFDATTTFVALTYFPYFEEHVLPSFLIGLFGPAIMFVLKAVVVSAVLYVLDKETKDLQQTKFLKLVILVLGLAPGLRNFFRLVMGV